jgi:hypothetical protein
LSSKDKNKKLKKALSEKQKVEDAIYQKTGASCTTQEQNQENDWDH